MRYRMILVVMALVMVFGIGTSFAQKGPVDTAMEGCKKELDTVLQDCNPRRGTDTGMPVCL